MVNGLRVTLQPPDGAPFDEDAFFTPEMGANGGHVYSGSSGFWIEAVDAADGTHQVADFGWQDGKRGHVVTHSYPIIM